VVSKSIVTVSHSAAARAGATTPNALSAAVATSASLVSTARHCPSVNLRASPTAVVEANPATTANTCPASSAR
jgi:hypothetical protein